MLRPRKQSKSRRSTGHGVTLVSLILWGVISACATSAPQAPRSSSPAEAATDPGLQPGDALLLRVWREPELSDTVRVDEHGQVVLPLLGKRNVAGITADALEQELEQDLREYLRNPAIDITPLRRVSIRGAVTRPGLYTVDATVSLSDALALAGGVTPDGNDDDIQLVRDGAVMGGRLERSAMMVRLPIRSGDQIYVRERSWLSRNWRWLAGPASTIIVVAIFR